MKIYISGKITGLEKEVYQGKFKKAAKLLTEAGHTVIDPTRIDEYELTYAQYMAIDSMLLTFSDAIYLLDNWEDSNGAKMEKELAESLGLKIIYESKAAKNEKE